MPPCVAAAEAHLGRARHPSPAAADWPAAAGGRGDPPIGSARLVIVFGWIRFICSNGLIIGRTLIEIRERHDGSLAIDEIPDRIAEAFGDVEADRRRRLALQGRAVRPERLRSWVDGPLSAAWGRRAAARVLHICSTGRDAAPLDPFAPGAASQKPLRPTVRVAGSPEQAGTLYDVMQAMSHVAGTRTDATEQRRMLEKLDDLLQALG